MLRHLAVALVVLAACRSAAPGPVEDPTVPTAGAADSGPLFPPDASDPGSPDASAIAAPDAGASDAGGVAGTPDASTPLGWHCDGFDAGSSCNPISPSESPICRRPWEPDLPVLPTFDGGIPGPCGEAREFGQGSPDIVSTWSYDSAGRVLQHTERAYGRGFVQHNTWDACGRLVYWARHETEMPAVSSGEFDYDEDGLLARQVATNAWPCMARYGYLLDDKGEVVTVYDPSSCTLVAQIDRDGGSLTIKRPYSMTHYDLMPDGGVAHVRSSSVYGLWHEAEYDESGRPLTQSGTGSATSIVYDEQWTWSAQGLVEHWRGQQGNGCSNDTWQRDRYAYDGGVLVQEDHRYQGPSCPGSRSDGRAWSIDYWYPDGGVRFAETTEDGGVTVLRHESFDFRGNLLHSEASYAPDFSSWYPLVSRNYDCLPK